MQVKPKEFYRLIIERYIKLHTTNLVVLSLLILVCGMIILITASPALAAYNDSTYGSCPYGQDCSTPTETSSPSPSPTDSAPITSPSNFATVSPRPSVAVISRDSKLPPDSGSPTDFKPFTIVASFIQSLPPTQQKILPYYLWIILIILAIILLIEAAIDRQRSTALASTINRLINTLAEQKNFIHLVLHILRTPLTSAKSSVELLEKSHPPETAAANQLIPATLSLAGTIIETTSSFDDKQKSGNEVDKVSPKAISLASTLSKWYFLVPVLIVLVLTVIINFALLKNNSRLATSQLFYQIVIGFISVMIFANAIRLSRVNRYFQITLQQANTAVGQLNRKRKTVINGLAKSLGQIVGQLKLGTKAVKNVKIVGYLTSSTTALEKIANRVEIINQITKSTPGFCDISRQIDQILTDFKVPLQQKSITVNQHISVDQLIYTYSKEFNQVMSFVIDNAITYNHPQGAIEINASADQNKLIVKITDSGKGMSKTEVAKLFQPFSKAGQDTLTASQEGIGLSLYTAKIILDRVDGEISVKSEPGHGATVKITLPRLSNTNK